LVRGVFTHPAIYDKLGDDYSGLAEDYFPVEDKRLYYLKAKRGKTLLGVFLFLPRNHTCFEAHIAFLPDGWGAAAKCSVMAFKWIFKYTLCRKIIAEIPVYNRLVVKAARDSGMTEFGVNTASFLKGGKLRDQVLLGIKKQEN
jgi:RimJ/RimL family protein N-acetyltransferase